MSFSHTGKRELFALLLLPSLCRVVVIVLGFPPGVMGWSAVCDCGISWSYSLTLWWRNKGSIDVTDKFMHLIWSSK